MHGLVQSVQSLLSTGISRLASIELFTCSGMVYGWTWTASMLSGPHVLSIHHDTNWEQWSIVKYNDSVIVL